LGTNLLLAVSGICRFCMVIRSLLPISMETCSLFACVGTQKGCAGHCLLVGRGGKFDLLRV
jgi:hypothetical protein